MKHNIGLNIARHLLPQIKGEDSSKFIDSLRAEGITVTSKTVHCDELKPSQGDYDVEKVRSLISSKAKHPPIIVSSDGYILDGHHRWAAKCRKRLNKTLDILQIDLPILELIKRANEFGRTTATIITKVAGEPLKGINIR